jgi:peptidoglycan/LPS O-acetylase OafA/YrhL
MLLKKLLFLASTYGWAGVDLFFVLSGFLITGILLDTRESTNYFRSFYSRRALRIFPLYYSFLLLAWLVFPSTVSADWLPMREDWRLYPTYLMNWQALWKGVPESNIVGHFWSLCVEEQFYFLWPMVVLAIRPRWLFRTLVCAELVVIAGRSWWVFHYGADVILNTATITRMDGLLFGAGCAVAVRQFRFPKWTIALLPWFSALCLISFVAAARTYTKTIEAFNLYCGLPLLAVGFAAAVLTAVLTDSKPTWFQACLRWKPLTKFGKYAYGIYVFHVPVFYFVNRFTASLLPGGQMPAWLYYSGMLTQFALSYGIAALSYNYFEKRFLSLKERFQPQYRSTPLPKSLETAAS